MDLNEPTNNTPEPAPQSQNSNKIIKREGRVIEALPNAFFKVVLDDVPAASTSDKSSAGQASEAKKEVRGFLSGKMRLNRIKILPGDKVTLEMTEYDMSKGRIVYRLK